MKNYPRTMLVQTVCERRGTIMLPVDKNGKKCARVPAESKATQLYAEFPNLVPIGVFVGINDFGCIRMGWSRCRLAPKKIPDDQLVLMRPEVQAEYNRKVANSDVFNMERGVAEAMKNMLLAIPAPVGRGFAKRFNAFKQRCLYYFKDAIYIQEGAKINAIPLPAKKIDPMKDLMNIERMIFGGLSPRLNSLTNKEKLPPELKFLKDVLSQVIGNCDVKLIRMP